MLSPTHERPTGFVPGVHLKETTQAYIVVADLPGMKRNDVDVEIPLGAKRLVLSGKSFESIIPLQPDVDVNAIEAAS